MNQEQAKQWLPEVTAFAQSKQLWGWDAVDKFWYKHGKDTMFCDKAPYAYIIEDEHFEARKAHALGKPIQQEFNGVWEDVTHDMLMWTFKTRPKPLKWYDTVSADNPVLCWVWNCRDDKGKHAAYITSYSLMLDR